MKIKLQLLWLSIRLFFTRFTNWYVHKLRLTPKGAELMEYCYAVGIEGLTEPRTYAEQTFEKALNTYCERHSDFSRQQNACQYMWILAETDNPFRWKQVGNYTPKK